MNEQHVYNCGTIELVPSQHTGRRVRVGVFAVDAETCELQYHLSKVTPEDLPELSAEEFSSLQVTLGCWMARLKDTKGFDVNAMTSPRGGTIQFCARSSILRPPDSDWFTKLVDFYLPNTFNELTQTS